MPPSHRQPTAAIDELLRQGRIEEARSVVREALAREPDDARLHNLAAVCAVQRGDGVEAERLWQRAAELEPALFQPHFNLGLLYSDAGLSDLAQSSFRAALRREPENAEARFRLAMLLLALPGDEGRAEARALLEAVLEAAPEHLGALNELGRELFEGADSAAARELYVRAVDHHPQNATLRLNLGNVLQQLDELEAAQAQFEAALALEPALIEAHRGLASVHQRLGNETLASRHREQGFAGAPLAVMDHGGGDSALPLLILASAWGGNLPWHHLFDRRRFQATVAAVEYLHPDALLPGHRLVFNAVGDADLCREGVAAAARWAARSDAPVLNRPEAVAATGRLEMARRLAPLDGVLTPHTALISKHLLNAPDAATRLAREGFDFPVLLRSPGHHGGHFFERADEPLALRAAVAALPGEELLVLAFLDGRTDQGWFRKMRVVAIDGVLYPVHLALSRSWKVHYYSSQMAEYAECREEEARFLADFRGYVGTGAAAALQAVAEAVGLDYFGIDFGLDAAGNVLLYEANATMAIDHGAREPGWGYKRRAIDDALNAARAMFDARLVSA